MIADLVGELKRRLAPLPDMPDLHGAGVYIFCLRDGSDLPGVSVGADRVLYAGMTEDSLSARNHYLHRNSGFSTFRRSLGALLRSDLDLTPVRRDATSRHADKYRFTEDGEQRLSGWMGEHLLGAQAELSAAVGSMESQIIAALEPPLNLTKWRNPQKSAILAARAACRDAVRLNFA